MPKDRISYGFITASEAEALTRTVRAVDRILGENPELPVWEDFPVRLTGMDGTTGFLEWTEQTFDSDGLRFDKPGGLTGAADWMPCSLPNGSEQTTPIQAWMRRSIVGPTYGPVFEPIGAIPDETIRVGAGTEGGVGVTYQTGTVVRLNPATDIRTDAFSCYVVEANGSFLSVGGYVHGKFIGFRDPDGTGTGDSSLPVYEAACCGESDPTTCPCPDYATDSPGVEWTMTVAGISCSELNGTFCLHQIAGGDPCFFVAPTDADSGLIAWELVWSGGLFAPDGIGLNGVGWYLLGFPQPEGVPDVVYFLSEASWACAGPNIMARQTDAQTLCSSYPATITVTQGCGGSGGGDCTQSYPATLTATITGHGCANGTYSLTWTGLAWQSAAAGDLGSCLDSGAAPVDFQITLSRDGSGNFTLLITFTDSCNSFGPGLAPDSVTCDPLELAWDLTMSGCDTGANNGAMTLTITE